MPSKLPSNYANKKKPQKDLFERGFKAWCENTATNIRKRLALKPHDPLSAYDLATYLGVTVWKLNDVPNLNDETRRYLSSSAGDEWSALTVSIGKNIVIIVNPTHSLARNSNNLMHELSHLLRSHEPGKIFFTNSGLALRNFDDLQEAEANWLSSVLLLPRVALIECAYRRIPQNEIINMYNVSRDLYTYRLNISGVKRQFKI